MWENIAIFIVVIFGLLFATFMTIGLIFIMAGGVWTIFGVISLIIGIIRMVGKIFND